MFRAQLPEPRVDVITIDGMIEHDFRHSIEDMLRLDQVDEAVGRLRELLKTTPGVAEVLPPRFLNFASHYVEVAGWERIGERLREHSSKKRPITAIGVTLADPRSRGGPTATGGWLAPFIKTFYFSDAAFPFSGATRDDLLEGYSREGFEWQGDYQATDATLSIKGLDDLYGAIIELENRLFTLASPGDREVRAGSIGACYLAVLIHQAVRDAVISKGLPRELCVIVACDGVYPFFDAPVVGCSGDAADEPDVPAEAAQDGGASGAEEDGAPEAVAGEASLLTMFSRKAAKAPVMVLSAEDIEEAAIQTGKAEASRLNLSEADGLPGWSPPEPHPLPGEIASFETTTTAQEPEHFEPWPDAEVLVVPAELEREAGASFPSASDLDWLEDGKRIAVEEPLTEALPQPFQPDQSQVGHSLRSKLASSRQQAERSEHDGPLTRLWRAIARLLGR